MEKIVGGEVVSQLQSLPNDLGNPRDDSWALVVAREEWGSGRAGEFLHFQQKISTKRQQIFLATFSNFQIIHATIHQPSLSQVHQSQAES